MEQTPFLIQVHNLQRLYLLRQLTSGNISIHIQDLSFRGLGQAAQDRQSARPDRRLDRALVDLRDLAYESVLLAVEVVGGEYSGGDRTGACAKFFERCYELEVLVEKDATGDLEGLCILGRDGLGVGERRRRGGTHL